MHGTRRRQHGLQLDPIGARARRRPCDWPQCRAVGEFRAPKGRDNLRQFFWFCLDHVREYNRAWDYFKGMNQSEIEAYLREDVTWHRPTWRFGTGGGVAGEGWRWQDPFGVFADGGGGFNGGAHGNGRRRPQSKDEQMLAVLELERGVTRAELKARYKQLVKLHHPDLHGGDKRAEERLKQINEAYTYLLATGLFL